VSEERITKVAETYRGIRNALRYQLSNLYDFDPAKHAVLDDKLTGLDRWILGEFSKLEQEVLKAYDDYEFHVVYQKVSQFVAVELSSIYHDVIKDRLYTDPANSHRRRSTQTALHRLVTGLCQMLAPILAFTADEAWEFVPGKNVNSVHESEFKPTPFTRTDAEAYVWEGLIHLREQFLPHLEKARQVKEIGKALDAKLTLNNLVGLSHVDNWPSITSRFSRSTCPQWDNQVHAEPLRELLNLSQLEIRADSDPNIAVLVAKADGIKCERCWHWETDVGSNSEHPTICGRCVEAVKQFKA
ncbi:MAG TPA: class I tRNA ligase family protein, partial [Sedimentisphaerales bacterium]